jgi:hypothetical protein
MACTADCTVVAGHHDDESVGMMGFDTAESLQATGPGQSQIEQNGIDSLALQQAKGMLGGIGHVGHETEGRGDFPACVADGSLVVNDEEVQKIGGQNLGGGDRGSDSD